VPYTPRVKITLELSLLDEGGIEGILLIVKNSSLPGQGTELARTCETSLDQHQARLQGRLNNALTAALNDLQKASRLRRTTTNTKDTDNNA
jgi:hypothetical protein